MRSRRASGSGTGTAEEERPRIGVHRLLKKGALRRGLDDLAEIHHGDAMGHVLDDGEVMTDEEQREPELFLQILQEVDDLGLHRDIERRDRLVADDDVGFGGERPGDTDALALPAGELMRPAGRWRRAAGRRAPSGRQASHRVRPLILPGRNCGWAPRECP